jgi:hypothetical protein
MLKNDAILGIDTTKTMQYWESILKNDAIHLVIKGSWDPDPGQFPVGRGECAVTKCAVTKIDAKWQNRGVRVINDATSMMNFVTAH